MKLKNIAVNAFIVLLSITLVDAGTLRGHVKYDGKLPKKKKLRIDVKKISEVH